MCFLWSLLQQFYKEQHTEDRLQNLVLTMIRQGNKPPKLRSSAAQCRAMVPWGSKLCNDWLDVRVVVEQTAKQAMYHLHQCYLALSESSIFATDVLLVNSTKFALLYVALEAAEPGDKI